jgi:DNA-binding IclR family transcriptional regulator
MIIVEEMETQEILGSLKEGARSIKELAQELDMPSERVFRYMMALKRKEMVALEKVSERTPIFQMVPQEV